MLILSRRPGESMTFCEANLLRANSPLRSMEIDLDTDTIQVFVLGTADGKVKLGIKAPKEIPIRSTRKNLSDFAGPGGHRRR